MKIREYVSFDLEGGHSRHVSEQQVLLGSMGLSPAVAVLTPK